MSGRCSRAWVEVDLAAVVENARTVARVAGTRLLPVVKANGYGVGAVAVCRALEAVDPWGYGVATPAEGAELRDVGITRPIVVLMPVPPALFDDVDASGLTPTLGDRDAVAAWTARGPRPFHLEVDTGMGRCGVRWDEIEQVRDLVDTQALEGCYTQFHSAERDDGSLERQTERFLAAVSVLPRRPPLLHVANSAAALRGRRYALDLVRPGLFLYGGTVGPGLLEPRPVVSLRARVLAVRHVAAGEGVSYGALWRAAGRTQVATLGVGYADGVRRSFGLWGRAAVLLDGTRCPVVGAVTMDLAMVDVAERAVQVGDVATLLGEADGAAIRLDEYALATDTLQHEALTALRARLPRLYD
ncbi:MAG TPA: alanine racemase [Gemmatimonadales bacterium]|nr:alanine racemase [Gemmatimonadales bacterium]